MKRAPLSVWIARVILLLASFVFAILTALAAAWERPKAAHFMYPVLLVVLPVFGFAGLLRPAWWGRRVATLGLLCVWGFVLRTVLVWGTVAYLREILFGNFFFSVPFFTLTAISAGVPLLLLRLYRGKTAASFFANTVSPYR